LLATIQEIGAAAGVVAVVGLAVLSALYFSQARDVKRLREWAGRAPERSRPPVSAQPVRRTPSPQRQTARPAPSRRSVLVGLLVLGGAAAYGVTQLIGDDLPDHNGSAAKRRNVTVAVLNGTMVPGLAAALSDEIAAAGFKKGTIDDYSDKQLAESVVQYAPGHEAAAKAVGRALAISGREPVTPESRALAPDATVIVIAGADKAP
jgi:hypothetical protein